MGRGGRGRMRKAQSWEGGEDEALQGGRCAEVGHGKEKEERSGLGGGIRYVDHGYYPLGKSVGTWAGRKEELEGRNTVRVK